MECEDSVKKSSKQAAASFMLYQLFIILFSLVVLPLFAMSGNANFANAIGGACVVEILAIVVIARMYKKRFQITIPHSGRGLNLKLIMKASVIFVAINYSLNAIFKTVNDVLGMIGYQLNYFDSFMLHGSWEEIFYLVLDLLIVTPIVEEIYYRGILLNGLKRHGVIFALFASSLLFGLAHGSMPRAISMFSSSFVLGYLFLKTNSIIPGIIVHMLNNGVTIVQSLFVDNVVVYGIVTLFIIGSVIYTLYYAYKNIYNMKQYVTLHSGVSFIEFFKNWQVIAVCIVLVLYMLPIIVKV